MQSFSLSPLRRCWVAVAAAAVLALPCALGAQEYHAVVIRTPDSSDYLWVERVRINERSELGVLERDAPLSEHEYQRLESVHFSDIKFFRVAGGRLRVRRRNGAALLAVPRDLRRWERTRLDPQDIIRASTLSGQVAGHPQLFTGALGEGWTVYFFSRRPEADALAFTVAEAHNTEKAWNGFLQQYPESSLARSARESLGALYLARAQESVERYRQALRRAQPGYVALGEARHWLDRLLALNQRTPEAATLEASLNELETDLTNRLRQARKLAERGDFAGALNALAPIHHFRDEFPELGAALRTIAKLQAQFHLQQARTLLQQGSVEEASRQLEQAASFYELDEIPVLRREIEGRRLVRGRQSEVQQALGDARVATARQDYARAFDALWPAVGRYPDDGHLQQEFAALRRVYMQELLAQAAHAEERHTPVRGPADEEALLRLHRQLTRVNQYEASPEVSVWRDRISILLADFYRQRSEELARRNGASPSPLAFAYLQQARQYVFDENELAQFAHWRDLVEEELRVGIALKVRDLTPAGNGEYLAAELSTLLGNAIQEAGFPHVEVYDQARAASARPALELTIELLHAAVDDTAETKMVPSEYSAGVRQAPNPRWREAKADYDQAVENYERTRARIEQSRRNPAYSEQDRQRDNQALARAEATLGRARKSLDAVPAFTELDDTRPYEFTRRTIARTGLIRLAYRWVNVSTGVRETQQLLEEKEPVTGEEATGVHPADRKGHRNQSAALPEPSTLRGRVLRKLQKPLAERTVSFLTAFIERDFERAQQEAVRGSHEKAAEYYLRFLFNSRPDDRRREEAFAYLEQQFRLVALGGWLAARDAY